MADNLTTLRSLMASHSPPLHALVIPSKGYHHVLSIAFFFHTLVWKNYVRETKKANGNEICTITGRRRKPTI